MNFFSKIVDQFSNGSTQFLPAVANRAIRILNIGAAFFTILNTKVGELIARTMTLQYGTGIRGNLKQSDAEMIDFETWHRPIPQDM